MFLSDQSANLTRLYYCSSHSKINFKLGRAFGKNEGKSAAIFCHQVAAWVTDMFCNFYLVKSQQPLKLQKNKHRFGICRILDIFYACLTKFENYQILLNKISHRFPMTTSYLLAHWTNNYNYLYCQFL
jgi:hypothetical protein